MARQAGKAREMRWRWSGYVLSLAGASLAHGAVLTGAAFIGIHAIQARERAADPSFAVLVRFGPERAGADDAEPPRGVELALSDAGEADDMLEPVELTPELLLAAAPFLPDEPEAVPEPPAPAQTFGPIEPEPVAEVAPLPEPEPLPPPDPAPEPLAAAPEPGPGPGPLADPSAPAGGEAGSAGEAAAAAAVASAPHAGAPGGRGTLLELGGAPPGPSPGTADGTGSGAVRTRVADLRSPEPLEFPDPEYPRLAQRLGEEGSVVCLLHVDARGRVTRVEVERSSGHARLDEAAVERLAAWTFRPATLDGKPVASTYRHRVRFELQS